MDQEKLVGTWPQSCEKKIRSPASVFATFLFIGDELYMSVYIIWTSVSLFYSQSSKEMAGNGKSHEERNLEVKKAAVKGTWENVNHEPIGPLGPWWINVMGILQSHMMAGTFS